MLKLSFCTPKILCESSEKIISALPFGNAEVKRLKAIKNEKARLLSLAALVALHNSLGIADELTLLREDGGKPYFEASELCFSLSHTEGLATAVLSNASVGIDMEWISPTRDIHAIAKRFFSADEQRAIKYANDPFLTFFSLWTKKEAYAKLNGKGLASVCSDTLPQDLIFSQFTVELEGKKGVLSICHTSKEEISVLNPYKELKLYELQN